ncbi:MAG: Fic family protein [Xanthomonadales bacterium]|nr:Fic family protein [Xanthomonadales bacterium]
MKLPLSPPSVDAILGRNPSLLKDMGLRLGGEADVNGRYEHWDHLRHLTPPAGYSSETWWAALKLARSARSRPLPLTDKAGRPIWVALTDTFQRRLHFFDRSASGSFAELVEDSDHRTHERHLARSLIEEAMTSSQLEGASTTSEVAKAMLRSRRPPRDKSERMIVNNYRATLDLARWIEQPLTPERICEIHRVITDGTLDNPDTAGRLRKSDEAIHVVDGISQRVLHEPPPAHELSERMLRLCAFANDDQLQPFLHPVVRAIAIHFQMGYDHPFVDGNGRTARTLFYWSMLRSGYWLSRYLSISSVIRRKPADYQRAYLYTESDGNDLGYFVEHQLDVMQRAFDGLMQYVRRKRAERRDGAGLLRADSRLGASLNHRQRRLLEHALQHGDHAYTIAEHQRRHTVTYQTARTDLLDLAKRDLLELRKEGRAFTFFAPLDLAARIRDAGGRAENQRSAAADP